MRCIWNTLINLLNPDADRALLVWFENNKPGVIAALRVLGIAHLELASIGVSRLRFQIPGKLADVKRDSEVCRCDKPRCHSHMDTASFVTWREAREAGVPEEALNDFDVSFADDGGEDELCIILEWLPECLSAEELEKRSDQR